MTPEQYAAQKFNRIVERYGDKYLKVEEEYKKMLADEYRALSIMGGKYEN